MTEKKSPPLLVSVIIPTYNSEKTIEACLSSLFSQKTDFSFEVIVVDSSNDSTPKIISEKFPKVKLIHLEKQTYPGAARNIGVEKSSGKILAFIDADCLAADNWLNLALENMAQGYSFVGGAVRNANPQSLISLADFILTFNEFLTGGPKREVKFMPTCNFICKKEAFLERGGFNPHFFTGEDTLFCHQAAEKYKLWFNPEIVVHHRNRENFQKFLHHHYNFGKHSAQIRKKNNLPGNSLAKYPLLALGAPPARLPRIFLRLFHGNKKMLLPFFLGFPLIFLGLSAWGCGFIGEAFRK